VSYVCVTVRAILQIASAWRRLKRDRIKVCASGWAAMPEHRTLTTGNRTQAWRACSFVAALWLNAPLAYAADATSVGDAVNNPIELQSLDGLSATRERPLFSPTRQPPPKPVAAAMAVRAEPPPPPAPPPSLVVLGIISENGEGSAAVRAADKGGKVLRVRTGDDVGGWKIDRIEPRRLVLTSGERSVDFSMFSNATKTGKDRAAPPRRAPQAH
jgi:general secretion pathway protein N